MIKPSRGLSSIICVVSAFCATLDMTAQTVVDELRENVRRAAGMRYAMTLEKSPHDTPPPGGKKPFYINHYGSPSVYYLDRPDYYDAPFAILSKADSLGKLTALGQRVLQQVAQLRQNASGRTGELTEAGKRQAREIAQQMITRVPDMFKDNSYLDARSVVQNHCLLTLGESVLQFSRACQPLFKGKISASRRFHSWMNPQDDKLENLRKDSLAQAAYADFTSRWAPDNKALMEKLFNDAGYASGIDAAGLSRQLFDLAGSTQYMETPDAVSLYDIFSSEDIHRLWMRRNAWAYLCYGGCTLNGGRQHYVQRRPLWNLIHMGDSIMKLDYPVIHLRYTHERNVMSLACLLDLDGYGVQTACLDSLEALGWADYRIAPLGGSIVMVHYRTDKNDTDPLVRVLLNGRETRLPIESDCVPYYHWKDVKRYYLRKLYAYARERNDE